MRTIILFLLLGLVSVSTASGRSPQDYLATRLNKPVSGYNPGTLNFVGALIRVSTDFRVPMGIAWVDLPESRAKRRFAWKNATVNEIIRDIVKTQSGYHVEAREGVLEIIPPIPDNENFLKIRVGHFSVEDQYLEIVNYRLHSLVAPVEGNHQISIAGPGDSKISLNLSDANVENVLDAICAASNRKIWVVTFSDDSKLTSRGLRKTISLWSARPSRPDEPGWDTVRWGDPTPPLATGTSPQ